MDASDQIRRRLPSHRRIIFGNIFYEAMRPTDETVLMNDVTMVVKAHMRLCHSRT